MPSKPVQHVDGKLYLRTWTTGRKPLGLGRPYLQRLDNETERNLEEIAGRLGMYYNKSEIVREATRKHVDLIYTELVNT